MTPAEGNWKVLDPSEFSTQLKDVEGMEPAELVVPIPKRYGGAQEEHEEATLEEAEAEMGGFTIAKSKEEAQKQMAALETEETKGELVDKFAGMNLGGERRESPKPAAVLEDYSGEDIELIQRKEQFETERQATLRKKAAEEQKKKAARQEQGSKEFNDWIEYDFF